MAPKDGLPSHATSRFPSGFQERLTEERSPAEVGLPGGSGLVCALEVPLPFPLLPGFLAPSGALG